MALEKPVGLLFAFGHLHRFAEFGLLIELVRFALAMVDHLVQEKSQLGQLVLARRLEALLGAALCHLGGKPRVPACARHDAPGEPRDHAQGAEQREQRPSYQENQRVAVVGAVRAR